VVVEQMEGRTLLSTISEFPIPTMGVPFAITAGPDGNLWFGDGIHLGRINPTTHAIVEFPLPTGNPGGPSVPRYITAGPDGNLWFTEQRFISSFEQQSGGVGMINPTTHAIVEFPLPNEIDSVPYYITSGPDGDLWFTEPDANGIGMINPTTHAIVAFPLPTAQSHPEGITAGPDGNLWFTDLAGKIGMINPTTHAIAEFPVPTANSGATDITTGPDGNLWFTEVQANQIGMINPTTHAIAEFPVPTANSYPGSITTGPDGNLWFTESQANQIGMINPTTHAIAEFPTPTTTANSVPGSITTGPDGNLWFTDSSGNIGQFALRPQVVGTVSVSQSRKETSYTLTFDQPLDAASASNVGLYKVFEGVTKVVKKHKETVPSKALKIKSVVYNAGLDTVTILLAERHKGAAQVRIAPGLEGTFGATSSTITLVAP
jgi:streptogramin lyase